MNVIMRHFFLTGCLLFLMSSCATPPPSSRDTEADRKLTGQSVPAGEKSDVEEGLNELQEIQRQDQRRSLERQITDPSADSRG